MAERIAQAVLSLTTDTTEFDKSLVEVEKKTTTLKDSFAGVGKSLGEFGKSTTDLGKSLSMGLTAPIVAVVGGLAGIAITSAEAGDGIAKAAREAGLGADSYQELQYALGQVAKITNEEVDTGFKRLNVTIGDAAGGSKEAVKALEKLGFTQEEIAAGTITSEDAFNRFNIAMQKAESPALAASLAVDLMGKAAGPKLASALRESGDEVDGLRKSAKDLGLVMDGAALDAAEEFSDALDTLTKEFGAVGREIGSAVLPILVNDLIPFLRETGIPMLRKLGDGVGEVIKWFANLPAPVQTAIAVVTGLAAAIGPVLVVLGTLVSAIGAIMPVVATVATVLGGLISGPLLLIVGAITAVVVAWRNWDVITGFVRGVYNGVKEWMSDKLNAIWNSVIGKIDAVKGAFRDLWDKVVGHSYVPDMVKGIADEMAKLDSVMVRPVLEATNIGTNAFKELASSVEASVTGIGEKTKSGFAKVLAIIGGGMNDINDAAQKGLYSVQSKFKSFFNVGEGAMGSLIDIGFGLAGPIMRKGLEMLSDLAMKGLKKIGGFFKDLFGGPSADELAGRDLVHAFEGNLSKMLQDMGKLEPGMESWQATVVAIRDAYIAQGRSEQEALKDAEKLWASSRDGADASRQVIEEITRKMGEFSGAIQGAFNEFPTELNIPVNFDIGNYDIPVTPMAKGGFGRVNSPTLFLAGEAGPEDFAFSGANKSFNGGGGGNSGPLTVNVMLPNGKVLAQAVVEELPRTLARSGVRL